MVMVQKIKWRWSSRVECWVGILIITLPLCLVFFSELVYFLAIIPAGFFILTHGMIRGMDEKTVWKFRVDWVDQDGKRKYSKPFDSDIEAYKHYLEILSSKKPDQIWLESAEPDWRRMSMDEIKSIKRKKWVSEKLHILIEH